MRLRAFDGHVERIEVHPAVALGEEPDSFVVGQELDGHSPEPATSPSFPHPRIVVQQIDDARLARLGVERDVPAILVLSRAGRRDHIRPVVGNGGHRPADISLRTAVSRDSSGGGRGFGVVVGRLVGRVRGGWRREASVRPDGLAGLEIQHTEQPPILRVADVGPTGNVFGVSALGHVVRHDCGLRASRALGDDDEHVSVIGRQHQVCGRLPILQLELREPRLLLFVLGFFLLALLLLDKVDQLFFLIAQETLAVGQPRLGPFRGHVGQLRQERRRPGIDRRDEEVPLAGPGDVRIVARPARVGLGAGRPGDLAPHSGNGVNQNDIAAVYKEDATASLVPAAAGRRRDVLRFFLGQLARRAAGATDDVGERFLLAGLTPVEIELLGVGGPSETCRRVADEIGPAHDAVDGQLESAVWRREELARRVPGGGRGAWTSLRLRDGAGNQQEGYRKTNTICAHQRLILGISPGGRARTCPEVRTSSIHSGNRVFRAVPGSCSVEVRPFRSLILERV